MRPSGGHQNSEPFKPSRCQLFACPLGCQGKVIFFDQQVAHILFRSYSPAGSPGNQLPKLLKTPLLPPNGLNCLPLKLSSTTGAKPLKKRGFLGLLGWYSRPELNRDQRFRKAGREKRTPAVFLRKHATRVPIGTKMDRRTSLTLPNKNGRTALRQIL